MSSKIKSIEVTPIKVPLKRKFSGSHYFMTHRCTIITKITTEDGIVGEIYNGDEMDAQKEILDMIVHRKDMRERIASLAAKLTNR